MAVEKATPPVRLAHAASVPVLATVLADAFSDDPAMSWVMNKPMSPALFETMIRAQYLKSGLNYLCGDGAAALWLPPGEKPSLTLSAMLRIGIALLGHGGLTAVRRGLEAEKRLAPQHPQEDHYYLFAVGTRSTQQGRGLGKAVLSPVLKRCDDEGKPAYLENSKERNTAFYRGLGFEPSAEPFAVTEGGPLVRPMLRQPR